MLCYRWWSGPEDDHYCELLAGHEGVCVCACCDSDGSCAPADARLIEHSEVVWPEGAS